VPTPTATTAFLFVNWAPGDGHEVYLRGELLGVTPLRTQVPVGTHLIVIRDPQSGEEWSRRTEVVKGMPAVVRP
jgi:hypothetical protein